MECEKQNQEKTRSGVIDVYGEYLEKLLELARKELGQPDFGKSFIELTLLDKIEGVSEEVSSDIVRVARHLKFLRDKELSDNSAKYRHIQAAS